MAERRAAAVSWMLLKVLCSLSLSQRVLFHSIGSLSLDSLGGRGLDREEGKLSTQSMEGEGNWTLL